MSENARAVAIYVRVSEPVWTESKRQAGLRRVSLAIFVDRALEHYLASFFDFVPPPKESLP